MNTNLYSEVYGTYKDARGTELLNPYQEVPVNYFRSAGTKGILIYHQPGVGKSRTAVAIAEQHKLDGYKIYVIEAKTLHTNMHENAIRYGATDDYVYLTQNSANLASVWQEHMHGNTHKKLFIFDEIHTFVNSIVRGSRKAVYIYDQICKLDCRVVALTGTPAINTPFEFGIMFNMLINMGKHRAFPEDADSFNNYFIDVVKNQIANKRKFQARIAGHVSYYGDDYFRASADMRITKENFPEQLDVIIERLPMSTHQQTVYQAARRIELAERTFVSSAPRGRFSKQSSSGTYRIASRLAGNYVHAPTWADASPKIDLIRTRVTTSAALGHKSAIYSNFIEKTIDPMAHALTDLGWEEYTATGTHTKTNPTTHVYARLTGNISSDERSAILQVFNDPTNANGATIMCVLISDVMSLGIELKAVRAIHLINIGWNNSMLEQIFARTARLHSHSDLPETERTVQPYIYLAFDPSMSVKETQSTDDYMYTRAFMNAHLLASFRLAVAEASIDCRVFNKSTLLNCVFCTPTNERLYEYNIDEDMKYDSPCVQYTPKKIQVVEIEHNGKKLYRDLGSGKIYDLDGRIYAGVDGL